MPELPSNTSHFQVTARAFAQIAEIAAREQRDGAGLRLAVLAGGCSGFQYSFALEDKPAADDLVIEDRGTWVAVDPTSLELLEGGQLDWSDELIGAHFTVKNPQAASGCGCGTSFAMA
ncbi:HesB/IscA family protein [Pseudoroseomonas globiformis]|uniref:HesB/IscA family protein n=1 Tax=Teichococcus globiformis TaxID=2307229 RepID=A0ABV7FWV9_9PROT